jgi:hypothetical protein
VRWGSSWSVRSSILMVARVLPLAPGNGRFGLQGGELYPFTDQPDTAQAKVPNPRAAVPPAPWGGSGGCRCRCRALERPVCALGRQGSTGYRGEWVPCTGGPRDGGTGWGDDDMRLGSQDMKRSLSPVPRACSVGIRLA